MTFAGNAQAGDKDAEARRAVVAWSSLHPDLTLAASRTVGEIEAGGAWSFAKFTIANAALRELAAEAAIGRKRRR